MNIRRIENWSNSDEYRQEIHKLIPGGCHTYSKGDDQFPVRSPAAIVRGSGSHIWDVDGNEFLDCSMGLTSVSLGHAYPEVVDAVSNELHNGVNFQRPSVLERKTAERFLELIPVHDMIKFAKSGSIVTTAAVKLARAATGRSKVAFPGDHPFYSYDDWFIGKTACGGESSRYGSLGHAGSVQYRHVGHGLSDHDESATDQGVGYGCLNSAYILLLAYSY